MKIFKASLIAALAMLSLSAARAGDKTESPTPATESKELGSLKKLQGHWEGTTTEMTKPGDLPQKIAVDYRVTSGGSAVMETLFAGSPHEMVSVYHDEGGKLTMTHYCVMGNQPHMTLQKASDSQIEMAVGKNGGVDPKSPHMHAVTLVMAGPDTLEQKWTSYEGGKAKGTSTFDFKRVPPAQ